MSKKEKILEILHFPKEGSERQAPGVGSHVPHGFHSPGQYLHSSLPSTDNLAMGDPHQVWSPFGF